MKAFILAAGLGTRLRPFTLSHPKALVPVGGVPMLERVLERLRAEGFTRVVVNVHHFASQITDFLASRDFGLEIRVSDETSRLLNTGGALLHAAPLLCDDAEPVLVHNVDILSDAPLAQLMAVHREGGAEATLLTSGRESSRCLVFDSAGRLSAWHNYNSGAWLPEGFSPAPDMTLEAFSGIHVISPSLISRMAGCGLGDEFSIIDFYLQQAAAGCRILHHFRSELRLIDIGKPATLAQAREMFPAF